LRFLEDSFKDRASPSTFVPLYLLPSLHPHSCIIEPLYLRYEVNPEYTEKLAAAGLKFVATNTDGTRMEAFDMSGVDGHPYFVGVQYHPEYLTRPLSPSAPYLGLLLACSSELLSWL